MARGGEMNLQNVQVTPLVSNPADYNVKADILNDDFIKVADFGADGIDVFSWWIKQDDAFRLDIVTQFINFMAVQIINGTAE